MSEPSAATEATAAVEPRWLDDAEQAVWRAFLDMHARLNAQLGREMQERAGISMADFSVLVQLSEHVHDRMRVLELARALRWEKSRLSHQLTRMTQRGLLERQNCSDDRRGAFVALTQHGRETIEAVAPHHVEAVRRYLFDQLDADQLATLGAIAQTVIGQLEPAALCDSAAVECGDATTGDAGCPQP
jgi:DNA-binding MarR family transcriptional regulator